MSDFVVQHMSKLEVVYGEDDPIDFEYDHTLNEPWSITYKLAIGTPLARRSRCTPDKTRWMIKRKGVDLMGGIHGPIGFNEEEMELLDVSGKSWLNYLNRRRYPFNPANKFQYVRGVYPPGHQLEGEPHLRIQWVSTDIFTIVEQMLTTTLALNNSLELWYNNGLSGYTQDFQFPIADMSMLLSHINNLGEQAPGFDYDVLADKEFKMWAPQRGSTTPSFHAKINDNCSVVGFGDEGIGATRMMGFGAGHGGDRLVSLKQAPAVEDVYMNYSGTEDFGSTRDQARLSAKTQKAATKALDHEVNLQLKFVALEEEDELLDRLWATTHVGDKIHVSGDTGYQAFLKKEMRLISRRGGINRNGDEHMILVLDSHA